MNTTVHKYSNVTQGLISAGPGSDVYLFHLAPIREGDMGEFWAYKGKVVGEHFVPGDVQGYEHIPQEFYASLDRAWSNPHGLDEFPDSLLDSLEVAGS
jgi:hypothetical protein